MLPMLCRLCYAAGAYAAGAYRCQKSYLSGVPSTYTRFRPLEGHLQLYLTFCTFAPGFAVAVRTKWSGC